MYLDPATPGDALRLYLVLQQANPNGYCSLTNAKLAEVIGVDERSVNRYLCHFTQKGWITVELTASGEGSQRKFFRKIYVHTENINTSREILKTYDNKENSKQVERFENDDNADCEELDEARDADTGEKQPLLCNVLPLSIYIKDILWLVFFV